MKKLILTIAILTLFPLSVFSQKKYESKEKVQVLVGFQISEITREELQNIKTLTFDGKYHIYNQSGFTLSPAFSFTRTFDEVVIPNYLGYVDIMRDVNRFYGGAELAKQFSFLRVGGGFFVGTVRLHEDLDRNLIRKFRGFAEIVAGKLVIRAFQIENESYVSHNSVYQTNYKNNYSASVGVHF